MQMKEDYFVLGLNGLGILPSACIFKNGVLIAAAEEERFTRLKNSFGFMPGNATKFCLDFAGISIEEVDQIAFGWDCNFYRYKMPFFLLKQYILKTPKSQNISNIYKVVSELLKYRPSNISRQIKEMFFEHGLYGSIPPINFINHHLSHAASTFYSSGFSQSYILIIDGSGEKTTTSIWIGNNKKIEEVSIIEIPNSLGWFYQSITEYLGFTPNSHEGKTMALAAYGKEDKETEVAFSKIITWDNHGKYFFNPKYAFAGKRTKGIVFSEELENLLGRCRLKNEEITQRHKNIAYYAQKSLEKITLSIVENISSRADFNGNICIAGGVGLNCKNNGKIAKHPKLKNLYIPPFCSDNGAAIGAAQHISFSTKNFKANKINHPYFGPEYSNMEIESKLKVFKIKYSFSQNIGKSGAKFLSENKIIAWFQGRMEIGPRALGARSILANPSNLLNRDFINEKIKKRELWRPFAASILEEKKESFIDLDIPSSFMNLAFDIKNEATQNISAAIHIDGTTRPQFVSKETNPQYWNLIKEFGDLTGVYALLNTSFNLQEEPIVCNPEQAIKTFFASQLDVLIIGNFIIEK